MHGHRKVQIRMDSFLFVVRRNRPSQDGFPFAEASLSVMFSLKHSQITYHGKRQR